MNELSLEEKIKLIDHYRYGGEIEFKFKEFSRWLKIQNPSWNWDKYCYRIKY